MKMIGIRTGGDEEEEDLGLGRTSGNKDIWMSDGTSGGVRARAQEVISKSISPNCDKLKLNAGG